MQDISETHGTTLGDMFCAQKQQKISVCKNGPLDASFSSYGLFEK
jgi:hypothetical protein